MKKCLLLFLFLPSFAVADTLFFEETTIPGDYSNISTHCRAQVLPSTVFSSDSTVTKIVPYIARIDGSSWTLKLLATDAGAPTGSAIAEKTISDPGGGNQWLEFSFDTPPSVSAGTVYAAVLTTSANGGIWNYTQARYTGAYYTQTDCSGAWSFVADDYDWPIKIYGEIAGGEEEIIWTGSATTSATSTEEILTAGFLSLIFGLSLIIFLISLFSAGYFYNTIIKPFYDRR